MADRKVTVAQITSGMQNSISGMQNSITKWIGYSSRRLIKSKKYIM